MATPSFHRPYEPFPRDLIPRLCTYVRTYIPTYVRMYVHIYKKALN